MMATNKIIHIKELIYGLSLIEFDSPREGWIILEVQEGHLREENFNKGWYRAIPLTRDLFGEIGFIWIAGIKFRLRKSDNSLSMYFENDVALIALPHIKLFHQLQMLVYILTSEQITLENMKITIKK